MAKEGDSRVNPPVGLGSDEIIVRLAVHAAELN